LRRSFWIVADGVKVSKESERFVVEYEGKKYEIAAMTANLIVIDGDFVITTAALELASRNDVTLALIKGGDLMWFYKAFPRKDVSYFIHQYEATKSRTDIVEALARGFRHNCTRLAKRLRIKVPELEVNEFYEYKANLLGLVTKSVSSKLGVNERKLTSLVDYLRLFVLAECLDSIVKLGLNPFLGFVHKGSLVHDLELLFEFSLLWRSLLDFNKPLDFIDINDSSSKRTLLRSLRRTLESTVVDVKGRRYTLYRHMRVTARSLRSSILNPSLKFEPFLVS